VEALVRRAQSLPRNAARSAWMSNRQYEETYLAVQVGWSAFFIWFDRGSVQQYVVI